MTVIVGYGGHPESRDALWLGAAVARALGARLLVASIYPSADGAVAQPAPELRAEAERLAGEGPAEFGVEVEAEGVRLAARSPARGLHDLAESEQAAAVVLGSSHRGALGRVLAGDVATQLFTGSPCAVAIAPRGLADGGTPLLRAIGVAFDDEPESWTGLQRAAALAVGARGSLRIIRAIEPLGASERRADEERGIRRAADSVSKEIRTEERLVVGDAVRVLETEGREGLDLLVLGSRGFGPLRRVLLGSVSAELVRLAPCALMIVPRSVTFDPSAGGLAGRDELGA